MAGNVPSENDSTSPGVWTILVGGNVLCEGGLGQPAASGQLVVSPQ